MLHHPDRSYIIKWCYDSNLEVFKTYLMEELSETTENLLMVCFQVKFWPWDLWNMKPEY